MHRPFDFVVACAPTALRVTRLEGEAFHAPSARCDRGIRTVTTSTRPERV